MEVCPGSPSNKQHCYPSTSVVPDSHTLLTSTPSGSKFFTVIDLCSAFFSVLVDEANQYIFVFTWEAKKFTWTVMPQDFTDSPSYFSQILMSDLDNIKFLRHSTLLQYVDDLLLCSPPQASSREDRIHLLRLLTLKEHKVTKEKLQFSETQV